MNTLIRYAILPLLCRAVSHAVNFRSGKIAKSSKNCSYASVNQNRNSQLNSHRLNRSAPRPRTTFGTTWFAKHAAYYPGSIVLSPEELDKYFVEGYLILRDFLPRDTVSSFREELLDLDKDTIGQDVSNLWLRSRSVLDIVYFGPFGQVASQLFRGTDVHLVRSTHHFTIETAGKYGIAPEYHYDLGENEGGFVPAHDVTRALVKFYMVMYDDMPAMWFVNQSALELLLKRIAAPSGGSAWHEFRAGRMPPPQNLCGVNPQEVCSSSWVPPVAKTLLDRKALKHILNIGDVIVHSTTLPHRSADMSVEGRPRGFFAITFGTPDTRYSGKHLRRFRAVECDSGIEVSETYPMRLSDSPRPDCFIKVFPHETWTKPFRILNSWPRR